MLDPVRPVTSLLWTQVPVAPHAEPTAAELGVKMDTDCKLEKQTVVKSAVSSRVHFWICSVVQWASCPLRVHLKHHMIICCFQAV